MTRVRRRATSIGALVLLLLAAGMLWEQCARVQAHVRTPFSGRLVDIGGRRLHLDCRGHGTPTLLLEAGLDAYGAAAWTPVHDRLAQSTRTCAYSRAGVFWSDPPSAARGAPTEASMIVRDVRTLMRRAGEPGPYVLVAHSMGALYALTYLATFPTEVAGLVLLDPTHPDQLTALRPIAPALTEGLPPALRTLASLDWTGVPRLLLGQLSPPDDRQDSVARRTAPFAVSSLAAAAREAQGLPQSAARARAGCNGHDVPLVVLSAGAAITPQVAAALGLGRAQRDSVVAVMARLHAAAARCSPRGRLERVADAGHYVQFDRPDRVVAVTLDVVRTIRAQSPR